MDFFAHQDAARRRSRWLVAMLVLAVLGIIAAVYAVTLGVMLLTDDSYSSRVTAEGFTVSGLPDLPYLMILGYVAAGVLMVVVLGSLYKTAQLAGGGVVVAEALGGRRVNPEATDPLDRRLLNVVEEMSLASGVAVPGIYVMEGETSINAFAAGWGPEDAVVGVTRGALEHFSRDELQGVIAHEFSHILSGDMRLNLRLVGLIFGIMMLAVIGRVALRSMMHARPRRSSSSGKDNSGAALLVILAVAVALLIIGSLGVFFGRLIQAAVSRQREYLADASAVQFTRHPDGIRDALRRLGGLSRGGRLAAAHAVEHRHFFFAESMRSWLGGALATHPPLPRRIRRIDPEWDGQFLAPDDGHASARSSGFRRPNPRDPAASGFAGQTPVLESAGDAKRPDLDTAPSNPTVIEQIGDPTPVHLEAVRDTLARLPAVVRTAAHTATGAAAVVLGVLLDPRDSAMRERQFVQLEQLIDGPAAALTRRLAGFIQPLDRTQRLALFDLSLPTLSALPEIDRRQLGAAVDAVIEADGKVTLFEWALRQALWRRWQAPRLARRRTRRLRQCRAEVVTLLGVLVQLVGEDPATRRHAIAAASGRLANLNLAEDELLDASISRLNAAIDTLSMLRPRDQKPVIEACAAAIAADRKVTADEGALLRAVAETLGVPVPPLVAGQQLV
jgi:Zn-dependent protease with chaperone function